MASAVGEPALGDVGVSEAFLRVTYLSDVICISTYDGMLYRRAIIRNYFTFVAVPIL